MAEQDAGYWTEGSRIVASLGWGRRGMFIRWDHMPDWQFVEPETRHGDGRFLDDEELFLDEAAAASAAKGHNAASEWVVRHVRPVVVRLVDGAIDSETRVGAYEHFEVRAICDALEERLQR